MLKDLPEISDSQAVDIVKEFIGEDKIKSVEVTDEVTDTYPPSTAALFPPKMTGKFMQR